MVNACKICFAVKGQVYIYPFELRQQLEAHSVGFPNLAVRAGHSNRDKIQRDTLL